MKRPSSFALIALLGATLSSTAALAGPGKPFLKCFSVDRSLPGLDLTLHHPVERIAGTWVHVVENWGDHQETTWLFALGSVVPGEGGELNFTQGRYSLRLEPQGDHLAGLFDYELRERLVYCR